MISNQIGDCTQIGLGAEIPQVGQVSVNPHLNYLGQTHDKDLMGFWD